MSRNLRLSLRKLGEILVVLVALFVALGPRLDEVGLTHVIGLSLGALEGHALQGAPVARSP
jgi:hypothetical protein